MIKLHPLSETKLLNLEFGQHIKSTIDTIALLGGTSFITDSIVQNYLTGLTDKSVAFDKAMLQIAKSDETAKIVLADMNRDDAVRSALRYLSVFELTKDAAKKLAYESLNTVFNTYKGVQNFNYEEETNGITNLVAELNTTKYAAHITTLNMADYVTEMSETNNDFDLLFKGRTQEVAVKVIYDVKAMRKELITNSHDLNGYILSMTKAHPTEAQYEKTLNVINAVRKYYYDLLAKRKPVKKGEVPASIPPMP